jgi:RimJ/RimL family protein N-acetyltransferase
MKDAARLYDWRIDAETVRNSIAPPPGSFDAHCVWLENVLRDPLVALFIAYDPERRVHVGCVRIDRRSDEEAEMSITVDPEQRGRRYSYDLIARGIEAAGSVRVLARVKESNLASLRAFSALGFSGGKEGDLLRLVREPAPVHGEADA